MYYHEPCIWLAGAIMAQACNDILYGDPDMSLAAFEFLFCDTGGDCDLWLSRGGLSRDHLRQMLADSRRIRIPTPSAYPARL
jgi:hypothetical protein